LRFSPQVFPCNLGAVGHQARERTRKRGLRDVLSKSPDVQRFLQAQMPKPTARVVVRTFLGRAWPYLVGLGVAFVLAAAATLKHWGA
jgi:hypothetical protein